MLIIRFLLSHRLALTFLLCLSSLPAYSEDLSKTEKAIINEVDEEQFIDMDELGDENLIYDMDSHEAIEMSIPEQSMERTQNTFSENEEEPEDIVNPAPSTEDDQKETTSGEEALENEAEDTNALNEEENTPKEPMPNRTRNLETTEGVRATTENTKNNIAGDSEDTIEDETVLEPEAEDNIQEEVEEEITKPLTDEDEMINSPSEENADIELKDDDKEPVPESTDPSPAESIEEEQEDDSAESNQYEDKRTIKRWWGRPY